MLTISMINDHHANPPSYETEILSSLSCVRAFETESVWIMCNAGGSADEGYIGGSGVWMPLKGKLAGVKGVDAGFEMVDVDMNVLKVSWTCTRRLIPRMQGDCTRSGPRTTDRAPRGGGKSSNRRFY